MEFTLIEGDTVLVGVTTRAPSPPGILVGKFTPIVPSLIPAAFENDSSRRRHACGVTGGRAHAGPQAARRKRSANGQYFGPLVLDGISSPEAK